MYQENNENNTDVVSFTVDAIKNEAQSKKGMPVFDKIIYIHICNSGMPSQKVTHEYERVINKGENEEPFIRANQAMRERYGHRYQMWKVNNDAEINASLGTPLRELPCLDITKIASLKELNVFTIEQLASFSDNDLYRLGIGANELKKQAQSFLENRKDSSHLTKIVAELEGLKQDLAVLSEENSALKAEISKLKEGEKSPKKRSQE